MRVKNADGDQLALLTSSQIPELAMLYQIAKTQVRKVVDDQLDEIVNELDKPSPKSRDVRRETEQLRRWAEREKEGPS